MKPSSFAGLLLLFLFACSGVNSEVKKSWNNEALTIQIVDVTSSEGKLMDAADRLHDALDEVVDETGFLLSGDNARFALKYKVMEFDEGSRLARLASLGISRSAQARLKVKAALFREDQMVGGWVVDSWLKGGLTGGSEDRLFMQAAREIAHHLRGDQP